MKKKISAVRELFYGTPIFFKDIKNSSKLNKHLLKHIKDWKKRDEKGIKRSNALGWHSTVDMHNRKEYNALTKELFKMQFEIYEAEGYHPDTEPFIDNMWANVNYRYSYNKNHVHPGSQWSGVYYIQCPKNSGNIWFTDPCGQRHIDMPIMADRKNKPTHYWREVYYQAIEGRLIMFPGWLSHEVQQNMTDIDGEDGWRVSVSFNFKQKWKQGVKPVKNRVYDGGGDIDINSLK
jgi:uncharacterized protein (TIGR02466 family)